MFFPPPLSDNDCYFWIQNIACYLSYFAFFRTILFSLFDLRHTHTLHRPSHPYYYYYFSSCVILQTTFEFHYGKHHAAYLNNLNGQIKGKDLENMSLEEVMLKTWNGGNPTPEFNNAAQVINHTFFWESMAPNKGGAPSGKLADAIQRDFGSFDAFKDAFKTAGATQFGSGWAWLSTDKSGKLEVTKTPNAENPWVHGKTPILTMDVWEHAYYLDVQNRRPDYMTTFFDLINWDKVAERYAAAV